MRAFQITHALLQRRWYTVSIVAVIGVGFALLASVLAVVDGVLFKRLGYPGESQLVAIRLSASRVRVTSPVRPDDLATWARVVPTVAFTGFGVWGTSDGSVGIARVVPNFFDLIGVRPAIGGFAPEDFIPLPTPRGSPLIEPRLVTHALFESRFGGDRSAIGRTVIENPALGIGYRIVGVMPPGFLFPSDRREVGYIAPFVAAFDYDRLHTVLARMTPGMTPAELRPRVLAAAAAASRNRGAPSAENPILDQVDIEPLGRALGAASRPLFIAFLAASALLLAIATLNAGSLMAARTFDRSRELAVRRALGARVRDIAQLMATEVAILIGSGTLIGLMLASLFLRVIVPLLPDNVVLFRAAAIDWRVIAFTLLVALVIAIATTMMLVRRAIVTNPSIQPGRAVTESARSLRRRLVVSTQVGLTLVLSIAGSLLVGSLLSVYGQREPITGKNVIAMRADFLDTGSISNMPERVRRVDALLERLRRIPGVDATAVTAADFLNRGHTPPRFVEPPTRSADRVVVEAQAVTDDYFRLMELQMVAGRLPTADELAKDEPVIVVGERVASHYWPNALALGQTLTDQRPPGLTFTVVGVVKDVRWYSWDANPVPTIYAPYELRTGLPQPTFLIRASAETSRVTSDALRVMAETDPGLRVGRPVLLSDLFVDSVRPRRLQAWLFGSFAAASLFVAAVGILGQLAMSTARRTREVGIRMACGATRAGIVRLIVAEQLSPVAIGLFAGGLARRGRPVSRGLPLSTHPVRCSRVGRRHRLHPAGVGDWHSRTGLPRESDRSQSGPQVRIGTTASLGLSQSTEPRNGVAHSASRTAMGSGQPARRAAR